MPPTIPPGTLKLLADRGVLAIAVVRGGSIVNANTAFEDLFGGLPSSAADMAAASHRPGVVSALGDPRTDSVQLAFEAQRLDGTIFEAEAAAASGDVDGSAATVLVVTDVTSRRRAERQLSYLAYLDPLTGLPNRALLLDRLRETLMAATRDRTTFAVLMCDLDGFKRVNDDLGHEAGDALLQSVARRLEDCVRGSDTVARHGGDEFTILLPRLAAREDAALVAERIIQALARPVDVAGTTCRVGVSVGIATFPADGSTIDDLIARSDCAMYESKRAGKNRFTFSDPSASPAGTPIPFFHWSEAHKVQLDVVDVQHRELVRLLNALGDDLKAGRSRDALISSLRALVTFTTKHFATEEQLMTAAGYDGRLHAREHRRLLDDLRSLTVDLDARSMTLTLRFLQEWLVRHIESMDKPMAKWLIRAAG